MGGVETWADTYTYTFTSAVFKETSKTSKKNIETQKLGDVSWTTSGVIPYVAVTGYDANKGQQFGSKNNPANFSISTSDVNGTITSIKINASRAKGAKGAKVSSTLAVSVGGNQYGKDVSLTESPTSYSFEGSSSGEVKISIKSVSTAAYIKSIEITYTSSSSSSVAAPTITPTSKEFAAPFTATIASTTKDATIYYTLDGSDPIASKTRQTYTSAGVSIPAATTTLKAFASLNGENSSVASATYTFTGPYANLAALKAVAKSGNTYKVQLTDAIVTLTNGSNCYIEDATAGILYYKKSHGYNEGDKLNGVATVTYTVYDGQNEITSLEGNITKETGATIPCTSVTLSDILNNTAQYESMRVKVEMAVAKDIFKDNNDRDATIADGDLELPLFNGFANSTYKEFRENAYVNVTGYPYVYVNKGSSTPTLKVWTGDIEAVKDDAVKITDAQYGTAYYADAFFMPTGATGYVAESNGNGGITLKETYAEGELVPAKTALVLNAPKGNYDICLAESDAIAPTNNLLHGTTTEKLTEVEGGTYKYYKLSYNNEGNNLGFYWGSENGAAFTNGAHKAYLALDSETLLSQSRGFSLADLAHGVTTGINTTVKSATQSNFIYDLNGRRINSLNGAAKGVYIMNGQKVLVK
uniref:chitobiase/beta-hexosaminidase C-terminal domain-containing protein n=1 Tax=Alloprevotella sp. TaxID=1872471 RepID=UPI0040283861